MANNNLNNVNEMKDMIKRKLEHLASFAETHSACEDYLISQLECTLEMIMALQEFVNDDFNSDDMSIININIMNAVYLVQQAFIFLFEAPVSNEQKSDAPSVYKTGMVGRPAFDLSKDIFEFYVENDFSVKDIASLLNISERTVYRRLNEYNLKRSDEYSRIGDEELYELLSKISRDFPCLGYRSMVSLLRNEGHKVQELRVRRAMKETDPEGVLFRRLFLNTHRIQRRGYHVKGPQALWHIDGNHKLIRWRFVIHGGIDGFSRLPVFLNVNTNNSAQSVLNGFLQAVQEFGLPEKVRTDKGKENVMVAEYMLNERGVACKPFITGRSVHNQRIERLWREVWSGCSVFYYNLFYQMEEQGILEPHNETHLAVLHLVFKDRIQKHLDQFKAALSRRPLRTEQNKSPWQLWLSGLITNPQHFSDHETEDQLLNYGVEHPDALLLSHMESVDVPSTHPIPDGDIIAIKEILDRESDLGIDIYQDVLYLVN